MAERAFPNPRAAALALLNGGYRLTRKAGQFLGQIAVDDAPLSDAQVDWLCNLLERAGLFPLVVGRRSMSRYPETPGAKGPDGTSQNAAEAIQPTVSLLRHLALRNLARLGEATVLEIEAAAGASRESLQPRLSELRALGLVEPTGARRRNPSGKAAAVLRLTVKARAAL